MIKVFFITFILWLLKVKPDDIELPEHLAKKIEKILNAYIIMRSLGCGPDIMKHAKLIVGLH